MPVPHLPINDPNLRWHAKEVLRDIDERPHLMVRIRLSGAHFPQRGAEPFVRVGTVRSKLVLIDDDELGVRAYFDEPIPANAMIEYGYGEQVTYRVRRKFAPSRIEQLDRARLPRNTRIPVHLRT